MSPLIPSARTSLSLTSPTPTSSLPTRLQMTDELGAGGVTRTAGGGRGGGEDGDDGEGNGALDRCPLPARPDRRMPPFFPPHQATYRIASPHALFARPAMHGPGDTPKEGQTSNTALSLQALSSRESPASRLFTFITILTLRIPPQTIREEKK